MGSSIRDIAKPDAKVEAGSESPPGDLQNRARDLSREDTDNRALFDPKSRYVTEHRKEQRTEGWYIFALLFISLVGLGAVGLGFVDRGLLALGVPSELVAAARKYEWLCGGGLLGGTVFGAKWHYHAIAKGLWHEDRRMWRYLSPWIALGTTVGIGALLDAGFFKNSVGLSQPAAGATLTGTGFLVGYLADSFLAKMKEVTRVLFGESETHFKRGRGSTPKPEEP